MENALFLQLGACRAKWDLMGTCSVNWHWCSEPLYITGGEREGEQAMDAGTEEEAGLPTAGPGTAQLPGEAAGTCTWDTKAARGTPRQQNSLACLGQEPLAVHHSNPTAYTASCGLSGGRSKHKGYQEYTVGLGNLLALPRITGYKPQTCTALTKATFKNLPLFLPGSSKTESRDKPTTL